jgi:hypothetical protein
VTENHQQVPDSPGQTCVQCSKPLEGGWEYCPTCGTKTVPLSTPSAIDAYVQNKVNLEISSRLTDQSSLVRELGDKAEDIVWRRLKQYGVLFGLLLAGILGFIAFLGIKTLDDVSKRIEPIVSAAEQRAQAAKRTIEETGTYVDSLKSSVDQLSRDVNVQIKRVSERGNEISQKFETLDTAATESQQRAETYRIRAEQLSARLEEMTKGLENRVQQVAKQVDNVSIRQSYPTLGQPKFVTYRGDRWKDLSEKAPNEKWINIYIDPMAMGDFSADEVEHLFADLQKSGYTPLPGLFGIGGPYAQGFGPLSDKLGAGKSSVFYFNQKSEQMAVDVSQLVSKDLSMRRVEPVFEDFSDLAIDDGRRFVVQNSGLDLQLLLRSRER